MPSMTKNNEKSDDRNTTINPFNEEVITSYDYDSVEIAKNKLDKTHNAFIKWKNKRLSERIDIILKFNHLLRESREDFSQLIVSEMGKTYSQALGEVDRCIGIIDYYCSHADEFLRPETRDFSKGRAIVSYEAQGVILSIQPWNFPLYQVIRSAIPNLLAGNTILLKHASNVWGCALKIEDMLSSAGLIPNAFTVLKTKTKDMDFLYSAREIRGVTFTGSSAVGSKVGKLAGENLKKAVLELGGNDAYLILKDANLEQAVEHCAIGRINNNGQTCICAKRFLVVEEVYEKFKSMFLARMKEAQMGDPMLKTTKLGPLSKKSILDTLDEQVEKSLELGAVCLTGGNIEKRQGYFYAPTVLENLKPGMPAYDDELFGPVASLIKIKNIDEAINISNSSRYGLGGGIFGANEEELIEVAKNKLDTGMVNINGYGSTDPNLPFGGVKDSGFGREFGEFGFHEFVNIKTIMIHENKKK